MTPPDVHRDRRPVTILHRRFGQFDGFIEHHNDEPCVVFRPSARKDNVVGFGVGLSNLHLYFETPSGMPTPYAFRTLKRACLDMGFETAGDLKKLMDALWSMTDDLVRAAPQELVEGAGLPTTIPQGIAELVDRRAGKVIATHEYH